MNFEMIENLCHMHTLLSDEDIQCIKQRQLRGGSGGAGIRASLPV